MHSIVVNSSKVHQTKYGAFPHAEMIGRQFGSKVISLFMIYEVRKCIHMDQSGY